MKNSLPVMLFMVGLLYMLPNQEKAAACSFDQDYVLLFHVIFFTSLVPSPLEAKEVLVGNTEMEWYTV